MSTAKPVRLQLSRRKGFNLQQWSREVNGLPAVNVARPSMWGNPFVVGSPSGCEFADGGDPTPMIANLIAAQCVNFYRKVFRGFISPEMHPWGHRWNDRWRKRTNGSPHMFISELRGKNLACWCALDGGPCHADVLLELAARP